MRLTLRTMLAYLDGILDAEDSEDIGKKIEESPFASDLIHRIRDLLRRPSVSVPDMVSQEPSLGPNAVAEYLDNTLPPNRVTEFEKICLESDIHLAEVAACHQILTLVLGEPAEIDPASRQRIYDIPAKTAATAMPYASDSEAEIVLPPPLPSFSTSSLDTDADRKPRPKPTIPDYLREPSKKYRWVSLASAGIVAACILIVLLMALGQFEPGTPLGNVLVSIGLVHDNKQIASDTTKESTKSTPQTSQIESTSPNKAMSVETTPDAKSTPTTPPVAKDSTVPEPAADSGKQADIKQPDAPPVEPVIKTESPPAAEISAAPPEKTTGTGTAASIPQPDTKPEPAATPTTTDNKVPKPDTTSAKDIVATTEKSTTVEPPGTAEVSGSPKTPDDKTTPPSERLGRCMSEDQLLLKSSGKTSDWLRVANKELLTTQQQLLALPAYRPEITLTSVNLSMLGGTELELLPSNEKDPAGLKIRFGRIVTMPVANAGSKLRIVIGERSGTITFDDPEAVVALEVRRIHAPGANPETEPARIRSEFFITTGHVLWDEKDQKTLELSGPARFVIENQSPPILGTSKDFPKWITTEPIGFLERRASDTMAQEMLSKPPSHPAQRSLLELAEQHRQKEVRWLAVKALGYLGYFDTMIVVLDDPAFKLEWSENYINPLREAIACDPPAAAAIRKALENRYPQIAADLYRMLWAYSDNDLASGEDEKLVEFLDNDSLAMRVLSSWNLTEITGIAGTFYKPEQTAAKRQQPIQRWKERLKAKEIRVKPADEKVGNTPRENSSTPGNE
jgi:hypothetical protein